MGSSGWRSPDSVIEQLHKEGHRFDFYQAVSLIERHCRDELARRTAGAERQGVSANTRVHSVGLGVDPEREAVRFHASLTRAFPACDLDSVSVPGEGGEDRHWSVEVNFMGLAGAFGPLPPPFTDAILQQDRDGATRAFLNIFEHRLIALMYQARRRHRPVLNHVTPDEGPFAEYLYSLIGLGTDHLRGRMAVRDRVLLHHAGVLAQQPRSLNGLERILGSHFGVPVTALPLQGRWLPLDTTQTTRLGRRNSVLGDSATLGTRVWDQQAAVVLRLGPLDDLATFADFLPDGRAAPALRDLCRFYVGPGTETGVRLHLKAKAVPGTRLARGGAAAKAPDAPRLGWTTWLTTRPRTAEGVVELRGARVCSHG